MSIELDLGPAKHVYQDIYVLMALSNQTNALKVIIALMVFQNPLLVLLEDMVIQLNSNHKINVPIVLQVNIAKMELWLEIVLLDSIVILVHQSCLILLNFVL